MNNLLAALIVLGAQVGAHSSAVLCGVTHLQDAQDAPVQAAAATFAVQVATPEDPPATDPAPDPAQALLDLAARFQRGETPRPPPPGLHGAFQVHVKNLADQSSIDARVERTYLRDPVRMVTTREDNLLHSDSTVGFDGERTWFRDNKTGTVKIYSDDPLTYDVDLELLRDQLRLMPVMLDAFVLDALIPRLEGVRLDGGVEEIPVDRRGKQKATVQWVVGRIEDELFDPEPGRPPMPGSVRPPPPELQVGLAIDAESGALWAFRVRTLGRSEAKELELRFFGHQSTQSGLKVPTFTAVHQDGADEAFITLGMVPDRETGELILDLDPHVDPKVFVIPE